jgi:hypothetical protein
MPRNGGPSKQAERSGLSLVKGKLDDDIDALFKLPLADFTSERNALATRLKQSGRASDAELIKTLAKPSISAWAVNQLYWDQRDAFERLLASGQRVRQFQTSGFAGKVSEMRVALDARSEALVHLSDLAASLLRDAGHSQTPDTLRRVSTTLEALSSYASLDDGPTVGRLTQDVDPPGFESLTSFSFGSTTTQPREERPAKKPAAPTKIALAEVKDERKLRKLEETRQAMLAATKLSLQSAKKSLATAQDKAKSVELAQKKAYAEAKETEKRRREAEAHFKKATAMAEDAAERSESISAEVDTAEAQVAEAKRAFEKASKELDSLLREAARS